MKINLLTCSSKTPPWLSELITDYEKKISFWLPFEHRVLKSPSIDRNGASSKTKLEGALFLKEIRADDFVIICDERGKSFDSISFSQRLEGVLAGGKKRVIFLVGGAYGLQPEVLNRADLTLKLAPFTLNHHLACAVLAEQIYRALTIIKGTPYHNP